MHVFIVVALVLGAVSAAPSRNGMLGNCTIMICISVFLTLFQPL